MNRQKLGALNADKAIVAADEASVKNLEDWFRSKRSQRRSTVWLRHERRMWVR